jgi:HEAT repeat protein
MMMAPPRRSALIAVWFAAAVLASVGVLTPHRDANSPHQIEPSQTRIEGLTLDEWRERMGRLNLDDPQSASAVPGLIALAQSADVPWFTRRQAALTLGRLGPHAAMAVPALLELLDETAADQDMSPQLWAIKALGLMGPPARDAVPRLVAILDDDGAGLSARLSAMEALVRIGPSEPAVIAALIGLVQTPARTLEDDELRRSAIEALGLVGPAASAAAPVLARALDDRDEAIRRVAATTLGQLGPLAEPVAELLVERMVADESPAVQDAAAVAVGQLGPSIAGEAVAYWLGSDDSEARRRTAEILGGWKSAAHKWLPELRARWDDAVPAVRLAALGAAYQIEGRGELLAPRVAALVGEDDREVRRSAVALLAKMGPDAQSARPVLEELMKDNRAEVRVAADKALKAIELP